ncbi:hypothetical protein [Caldimonas sp. KR1-144]|uniref:hypothetical protein n=1 Tax=Caldimonas sp. KR1-144 TaxID=3400911 RepID=UPI003C08612A
MSRYTERQIREFERIRDGDDALIDTHPEIYRRLIDMRGGCRCCVSPPCSACSEPLLLEEADRLGLLDDGRDAPVDFSAITKGLCK